MRSIVRGTVSRDVTDSSEQVGEPASIQLFAFTAGIVHEPSRIEGSFSFGQ